MIKMLFFHENIVPICSYPISHIEKAQKYPVVSAHKIKFVTEELIHYYQK